MRIGPSHLCLTKIPSSGKSAVQYDMANLAGFGLIKTLATCGSAT